MPDRRHLTDTQRQELLGLIAEAGVAAIVEALAAYVARYSHNITTASLLRRAAEELR